MARSGGLRPKAFIYATIKLNPGRLEAFQNGNEEDHTPAWLISFKPSSSWQAQTEGYLSEVQPGAVCPGTTPTWEQVLALLPASSLTL